MAPQRGDTDAPRRPARAGRLGEQHPTWNLGTGGAVTGRAGSALVDDLVVALGVDAGSRLDEADVVLLGLLTEHLVDHEVGLAGVDGVVTLGLGEVRLLSGLEGAPVGRLGVGLALVGDTADGENHDGGEDAEDHDDDEELDEGEALFLAAETLLEGLNHSLDLSLSDSE